MGSEQPTLAANVVTSVTLDGPAGRIVLTMISGAAEVVATADGSTPVLESGTPEAGEAVQALPPVVGAQIVLEPPLAGDHMNIPVVKLLSAGTPVVLIEW